MARNIAIFLAVAVLWAWLITPSMVTPKSHIDRTSRLNDLRSITLAILDYEQDNGVFPRSTYKNDGLLSWRVELLPYLGERKLYEAIDKSVSWDHPKNMQFHNQMPDVFRDPASASSSETSYRIVSGAGIGWTNDGPPVSFADIQDGSSNSIAIISIPKNEINWLAPNTLTIEYANNAVDFSNRGHCYSFFDGSTWDEEPNFDWTGSPFLISDAE